MAAQCNGSGIMGNLKNICVYCGSGLGADPVHAEAARIFGQAMAEAGVGLVYGGGSVGLMGAVADAALVAGGEVTGVMPRALVEKEIAHRRLTDLGVVGSMHERKALMAELSDGFVALPGGIVWTWAQLGHHTKPCALLNVRGFYDGFIAFLDQVVERGFMKGAHRSMLIVAQEPSQLIERLGASEPPVVAKWITAGER
jgi:uncharacterized protein (TIGR00730 family)